MPNRRKRGSFRDHDELVKLSPDEAPPKPGKSGDLPERRDGGDIHDRLFESAWRRAR